MKISKFNLIILFFCISLLCSITGKLSSIFIVLTIVIACVLFFLKIIHGSSDNLGINRFVLISILSMAMYMIAVYQTPIADLKSVLDFEYIAIGLKYIFGPFVLYLSALAIWEKKRNQNSFLFILIIINLLLIFFQLLNGIGTGNVLGSLHSNHMAALAGISLGVAYIFRAFNSDNKLLPKALIVIAYFALIFSLSRGAVIAVFVSFGTFMFLSKFTNKKFVGAILLTLLFSVNTYVSTDFNNILDSTIGKEVADTLENISGKGIHENGRVKLWTNAISSFTESPIVGIGVLARRSWDRVLSDGRVITLSIHNYYLAILLEAGIVGFLSILFLLTNLVALTQRYQTNVSSVSFAILIGVLFHQVTEVSLTTGTMMVGYLAWFTLGLGIRLSRINKTI
jgi:O-antigen ligase